MTVDQLKKHFGTFAAAAKSLDVSGPAISIWKRKGFIPYLRQLHIERVTGGKLKAREPKAA